MEGRDMATKITYAQHVYWRDSTSRLMHRVVIASNLSAGNFSMSVKLH